MARLTMAKTTHHIHLCVRGALKNMTRRELGRLFRHADGRACTADEARDHLLDQLSQGREVLPFGEPCEGFDYSGRGCLGHPSADAAPEAAHA